MFKVLLGSPLSISGVIVRIASILLIVNMLWTGWVQFGPTKPKPDAARLSAVSRAIDHLIVKLQENREAVRSIVFLNFANEPTDIIADGVRERLSAAGTFLVCERSLFDKIRLRLGMSQYATNHLQQALKIGKSNGCDGVLFGNVEQFETINEKAILKLDYTLVDCKSGLVIYQDRYDSTAVSTPDILTVAVASLTNLTPTVTQPGFLRFLGWLLIVFLFPIFTINFLITMTEKRSNMVNAFVLSTYTFIDAGLAWIMIAPDYRNFWSIAFFIALCVGALLYNVKIMSLAVKQNES